ncbi:MAG: serine/threonine-protein kinase, partial [Planctomycetota bacterium]
IGEGGFGVVFLAEQTAPVQRRVALKVIKLGMDTRQVVARFEQERQALALMDHPNIARVLDAGATATGRPYFVMDLVKGAPIVDYCDQNNLTIDERLELFAQVCSAVQHAHGKGVIHRDIKPSNVLVGTQDGRPLAKIIDFGIAKATSQRLTERTLFTEHQQVIGTLQYMSPEQAEGSLDIDTRTDVYSLGVLLYELLTGSTPFDRKTVGQAMLGELHRLIREVDPPRPSTRLSESHDTLATIAARRRVEPKRLGLLLRGDLDWIVMKALEKDRARRYETANGLAADVQRHLRGEAVVAAPPGAGYRLRKFAQRHRGLVAAVAAVVATLALGVAGTTIAMFAARDEAARADKAAFAESEARQLAQTNERAAIDAAKRAETAREQEAAARRTAERIGAFVVTALSSGDATLGGGQETTILAAMGRAIADLDGGRLADEPMDEAALRGTIANILRNNGQGERAYEQASKSLELYRRVHPGDHDDVAVSLNDVARAADQIGELDEAEALTRESLQMYERLHAGDHIGKAALLGNLGHMLQLRGRLSEAEPMLTAALAAMRRLTGDGEGVAKCLDNLAKAEGDLGRAELSVAHMREALAIRERLHAGDHPDLAIGLGNLGATLGERGDHQEAEELFERSLAMRRRLYQQPHPHLVEALTNLAFLRATRGRAREAEPLLVEAAAMGQQLFAGDHPKLAHCLYTLGTVRLALEQFEAAAAALRDSVAMHRRLYPGDHPGIAMSLARLALACQATQATEPARQAFDAAIDMLRRLPGASRELLGVLWQSSQARIAAGDRAAAIAELEELVGRAASTLPADSPKLRTWREALAQQQAAGGGK